jgi:GNAT superfamily N-acetyltransferase
MTLRQSWPTFAYEPERLTRDHDTASFLNGQHPALDHWLRERALRSEGLSARTYVVCDLEAHHRIIGYYALSSANEQRATLPSAKLRQGMPDTIPLLLIGRLAVDVSWHGKGLGTALLSDALKRCIVASDIVGARGIVAHAIDDDAARFYRANGFVPSPLRHSTMIMPIEFARAIFERP